MQSLMERDGAEVVGRALAVVALRLQGRAEAEPVREELLALRRQVREAAEAFEEARVRRMAATQQFAYADERLDRAVMRLSRRLLERLDGDRSHPRYRAVFVQAPSEAMAQRGGEAQRAFVEAVLAAARGDEEAAAWSDLLGEIESAAEALQQAQRARASRRAEELQARQALEETLERARLGYNQAYLKLRLLWPRERGLVESFFPRLRARREEPEAD